MLIYLEDYRNRGIARAADAKVTAPVCAGNSMLENRAAVSFFRLRERLRHGPQKVPERALARICALASSF